MKAALFEAVGSPLTIADVDIEDPGPGEVRVAVKHCGCCHSDLSVINGSFPAPLPVVLGHEASGVVESLGEGVTTLEVGDHVVLTPCPPCGTCYWCIRGEASCCVNTSALIANQLPDGTTKLAYNGEKVYRGLGVAGFAEYVVTTANGAVKISKEVPLDVACVIGCAVQTGVGAVLNTAQVEEGATVLVMGLGGIGMSIVQGARLAGAERIIVSDPVADRRKVAMEFGATDTLDPTDQDVVQAVMDLTTVGADYAFEAVGHGDLITTGVSAIRNGGTMVCVGAPPITHAINVPMASLFVIQEKKIMGCVLGSSNSLHEIPRLIGLYQRGRLDLDSLITSRRPLSEINEAMQDLTDSRGIRTVLNVA